MTNRAPRVGEVVYRTAKLDAISSDSRSVSASLSSEIPVRREWGTEILVHDSDAIDLGHVRDGRIPLLTSHDPNEIPRPGNVERVHLGADRKLRGTLTFAETPRGDELLQAVRDGYLGEVSLGYAIRELEQDGTDDYGFPVWRVTRWAPVEASLVNVPADATVGVGRSYERNEDVDEKKDTSRNERRQAREFQEQESRRVQGILVLKRELASKVPDIDKLAERALEDGTSESDFQREVLKRVGKNDVQIRSGRETVADPADKIGLTDGDRAKYSLRKALLAAATNDWSEAGFEREVSKAMEGQLRHRGHRGGVLIPTSVLATPQRRDVTKAGTSSATIETTLLVGQFIDVLRNASKVVQAGATVLPGLVGDVAIPRKTAASTPYWVATDTLSNTVTESTPTFDQVTLTPNTVGALVDFSRKMLLQSTPGIEMILREDLIATLGAEVDRVAIEGSGTPPEPRGVLNTSGIGSVTSSGTLSWAETVSFLKEVAQDNALRGALGFLTNAKVQAQLLAADKGTDTGQFIWERATVQGADGSIAGYPAYVSNNVPSDLGGGTDSAMIFGNWADVLIGEWGILEVMTDPYEHFASGGVRIRALFDVDVDVRHAQSFAAASDIAA